MIKCAENNTRQPELKMPRKHTFSGIPALCFPSVLKYS